MASLNKVFLVGNLTSDPQQKFTPSNVGVTKFGIAINKKRKDKNGVVVERTCFVDCDAWDKTGEFIVKYFHKGDPIFVEGELELQTWEKNGEKRSKLSVVVREAHFIDGKKDGGGGGETTKHTDISVGSGPDDTPF